MFVSLGFRRRRCGCGRFFPSDNLGAQPLRNIRMIFRQVVFFVCVVRQIKQFRPRAIPEYQQLPIAIANRKVRPTSARPRTIGRADPHDRRSHAAVHILPTNTSLMSVPSGLALGGSCTPARARTVGEKSIPSDHRGFVGRPDFLFRQPAWSPDDQRLTNAALPQHALAAAQRTIVPKPPSGPLSLATMMIVLSRSFGSDFTRSKILPNCRSISDSTPM